MSGFTKLVPEIIQSSIWNEPAEVRCVWIAMIATKDADGYVRGDVRTIARMANVSVDAASDALKMFQAPDPSSHTPDNEGRRIMPAPGGWIVLNHDLYRCHDDIYRERTRERVRKHRAKLESSDDVTLHETLQKRYPSASVSASVSASEKKGECEGEVDSWFERCWSSFGRYGVKKKAKEYARAYSPEDRIRIEQAIPLYLQCVATGRSKSQFEGWINPRNRKWDVDWQNALKELSKSTDGGTHGREQRGDTHQRSNAKHTGIEEHLHAPRITV